MKAEVLRAFLKQLSSELQALVDSARAAHEAATHDESKAEDRHDTFAIEASYLAAGQSLRVQELEKTQAELEGYLSSSPPCDSVAAGCLITYRSEGVRQQVLMAKSGGGLKTSLRGESFQILSSNSPLGMELLSLRAGDAIEVEIRDSIRLFEILVIE